MIRSTRYTHTLTAIALAAGCAGVAWGQTAPTEAPPAAAPAPAPDLTFSANVGLFSQYVFRGISQTDEKPAIQGGFPASATKADTTELYASLGWKFLSVKYSYVVGDKTFGFPDSGGSDYIEGNASYDVVDKVNDMISDTQVVGFVQKTF